MSVLSSPPEESVAARTRLFPPRAEFGILFAPSRRAFFTATGISYSVVILLSVAALNPYFSQTWDIATFIQAAHRFLDGGNPFDLYAQSRAAQTWPFAYPPLHALAVALALIVGKLLFFLPDYVLARVPVIIADIGVAWVLHNMVERRSGSSALGRVAVLVWLFNPVTFYNTAVQGHFESEWLFFVLLAYWLYERSPNSSLTMPAIALAIALLFKQVAILFAIPLWAYAFSEDMRPLNARWLRLADSWLVTGTLAGVVCLPFVLFSGDFLFMNLSFVANVPVQTQSWLVALLGLTRAAPNALVSDFILFRWQTAVTLIVAVALSLWGLRRGWSLYLTATLIAIAFFLTSKKVMGYYYVILLPFLLAEFLPRHRLDILLAAVGLTSFVALAPYYAGWVNHAHWWVYALGGMGVTLVFLLFVWSLFSRPLFRTNLKTMLFITGGASASAILGALLQPLIRSAASPIRPPIAPPGMEAIVLLTFVTFAAILVGGLAAVHWKWRGAVAKWSWGAVLAFAPLAFTVLTLTKESTAVFELALTWLGG